MPLTKIAAGHRSRQAPPQIVIKMRLRAIIGSRLTELDLDAATIAAAAGLSVRQANAMLADEQTSIKGLLLEARLEHCRHAIDDPAQSCKTISDIAQGCGFADVTHFARIFKATYGLLPSDYRARNRFARRASIQLAYCRQSSSSLS
jgi:AraC family transcriptional activator of tynA and feaB